MGVGRRGQGFEKRSELVRFLAVGEGGTIAIAPLMRRLGGRLFERTPAGVRLTAFVEAAAKPLRHILPVFETAAAELAAARGRHIAGLHDTLLPQAQATARFHRASPGIELRRDTTTLCRG